MNEFHKEDVALLAAMVVSPKECSLGPTNINMGMTFACEVTAEEDGEIASCVAAMGYTQHQPLDEFCPTPVMLTREGSSNVFKGNNIPFRLPPYPGDSTCKSAAPFAELRVKVWAWYRDPNNLGMLRLGAPAVGTFCGKCHFGALATSDRSSLERNERVPTMLELDYDRIPAASLDSIVGARLELAPGVPLRASHLHVHATDVRWNYAPGPGHFVNSPLGTASGPAGPLYRFMSLPKHCLIIYQPGGEPRVIEGTTPDAAIAYPLDPQRDVYIHLNDYHNGALDNSGTISIKVKAFT